MRWSTDGRFFTIASDNTDEKLFDLRMERVIFFR